MMTYIILLFDCRWAASTVMTRQNFVPSKDSTAMINALIPMWDMANHSNGKVTIFCTIVVFI